MVNSTGKNLKVIIITELGKDWQTFSYWYSFWKNLPDAEISITSFRTGDMAIRFLQWAKRMNIPYHYRNLFSKDDEIINMLNCLKKETKDGDNVLIVKEVMALREFGTDLLNTLNKDIDLVESQDAWYFNNISIQKINQMLNNHEFHQNWKLGLKICKEPLLCSYAKDEAISCLSSLKKGCGRWIDTLKGCPLSNAAEFVSEEMTINEIKIISLWEKMVPMYNSLK